jgi:3D (Asp-Asp-Asp) domain-containing protein
LRRRLLTYALRLGIGLAVGQAFLLLGQDNCRVAVITGFSVEQFPGRTADGTPTPGQAGAIAAGGHAYPLGTIVWVDGIGSRRIADRGHLGWWQVDVLWNSTREALAWGRQERQVCRE